MSIATPEPKIEAFPHPPTNLPEEDGVPLESDWHRIEIQLLNDVVTQHMKDREDFFVGGNMFIYYSTEQAHKQGFRGPDFFFVSEARLNPPRPYWAIWNENGKYPDVIIELSSPSTHDIDHGIKKGLYEQTFRTHEYFIFDPADQKLHGWRLLDHAYRAIEPNQQGRLWCEELGLWLGTWYGPYQRKQALYLRFFAKSGKLAPTEFEWALGERLRAEQRKSEKLRQRRKKQQRIAFCARRAGKEGLC